MGVTDSSAPLHNPLCCHILQAPSISTQARLIILKKPGSSTGAFNWLDLARGTNHSL